MNQLKVKATFHEEVYIDPAEALAKIKEQLGFANGRDSFLCVRDGELLRGEDISHHGSPLYEYTLVSNNPNWIAPTRMSWRLAWAWQVGAWTTRRCLLG